MSSYSMGVEIRIGLVVPGFGKCRAVPRSLELPFRMGGLVRPTRNRHVT